MSLDLEHTTTLVTLDCGAHGCGISFAIPKSLNRRALDDHTVMFYCPNGHHVGYQGKNARQKAEERAEHLERRAANAEEDARAARASLITTKGHLTRVKKRADAGVCQHCNRTFANVGRHVAHMHPSVTA